MPSWKVGKVTSWPILKLARLPIKNLVRKVPLRPRSKMGPTMAKIKAALLMGKIKEERDNKEVLLRGWWAMVVRDWPDRDEGLSSNQR